MNPHLHHPTNDMNDTIRLLYVEDSPQDADLTRAHFAREAPDFRLEIVGTGAHCLAQLETEKFDLLLLDNRLPDMEGLDVLGRLRASGQTLPVVMVTGTGDDETVAKALRAGAADYVSKSEGYLATLPDLLRGLLARLRNRQLLDGNDAQRVQRILYVEHNLMDAELTASHFAVAAPHLQLHSVASSLEALTLLAPGHGFDLVLTDLRMPDMSALELIREAQHRGIDLPFVVITGKGDEATAVAILRLGAYDYLVKRDNYLMQLPHAIDHALQRFRLDQTTRRMRAELKSLNVFLEQKIANRTAELHQEIEVRRTSEEKFRKITESAQDAIIMMGTDGGILFWNHAAERIFGYTAAEAMGQDLHALLTTKQAQAEFAQGFPNFQKSGTGPIIGSVRELTALRKNGEEVLLEISISAMRLKAKWHAIGILRDITKRKQAEEESHLMLSMGKAIAEAENFSAALDVSIRAICESTGWDFGEVWIPSYDGTYLELGAPYYCKVEEMQNFRNASKEFRFAPGIGIPGRVWASGKPLWDQDVTVDANFPRAPFAKQTGIRAAVGIPILSGNTVVAIMVFFMGKVRSEDERMTALISAIATQLGTAFQRKRDEENIQRLANFDALTGLPNRTLFTDRINHSISISQRSHTQLAVLFFDLDHFKNINDSLGHRIGDRLLIAVAQRLKSVVRDEDTISRMGGDEFILLLQDTDASDAARVAGKVLEAIAQPCQIEQYELVVTTSIGIAMYPDDSEDFESLYKCADIAMYRAKQDGRNNYCFFTPEMQQRSSRTLQLENALRHALERNQLQLHYQPQVSLQDGRIVGAEALLRWQHPELGMISPCEFIPVAEASGQIVQIGEWVLRNAARQLKTWMDSGLEPITMAMAVNLSAVQFRHLHLPDLVTKILEEVQLSPQYLELELTESVAMGDPLAAIAVMKDLHERGIRMSIDDFGTGYSSLSYIKRFNVYKLKIDQSFVRDITEDPDDKAIVAAIISMAKALGIQTIAEGVETEGQLAFLRENGCNEIQGYYYSEPLPADQFEVFVRNKNGGRQSQD